MENVTSKLAEFVARYRATFPLTAMLLHWSLPPLFVVLAFLGAVYANSVVVPDYDLFDPGPPVEIPIAALCSTIWMGSILHRALRHTTLAARAAVRAVLLSSSFTLMLSAAYPVAALATWAVTRDETAIAELCNAHLPASHRPGIITVFESDENRIHCPAALHSDAPQHEGSAASTRSGSKDEIEFESYFYAHDGLPWVDIELWELSENGQELLRRALVANGSVQKSLPTAIEFAQTIPLVFSLLLIVFSAIVVVSYAERLRSRALVFVVPSTVVVFLCVEETWWYFLERTEFPVLLALISFMAVELFRARTKRITIRPEHYVIPLALLTLVPLAAHEEAAYNSFLGSHQRVYELVLYASCALFAQLLLWRARTAHG